MKGGICVVDNTGQEHYFISEEEAQRFINSLPELKPQYDKGDILIPYNSIYSRFFITDVNRKKGFYDVLKLKGDGSTDRMTISFIDARARYNKAPRISGGR